MPIEQDERRGIAFALVGFALLSIGDAIIKTMAGQASPIGVAALRFTIGAAGLSLLLLRSEGWRGFIPRRPWLQVARGFCLAGATLTFFSAIFVMPLADTMAIAFVAPIFVALFSGPLLKERVRPSVWLVSIIALTGVALILRPNLAAAGVVALLPLASAFFFSLMVIANRASAQDGSALSMQAFIALWATPFLIIAALLGHVSGEPSLRLAVPDWTVVARCSLVALTASTAHWLVYLGTMRAGAATIAPVTYVQIVVATALGDWLFGDVPDGITLLGASIVILTGLVLWRNARPA